MYESPLVPFYIQNELFIIWRPKLNLSGAPTYYMAPEI